MIRPNFDLFFDESKWDKLRLLSVFESEEDLCRYQDFFIIKHSRKKSHKTINLLTSGSSVGIRKSYSYPVKTFRLIDNHHMWRIFHSHGMKSGNAVKIFQSITGDGRLKGPIQDSSMGLENLTWSLVYDPCKADKSFWESKIKQIRFLKPVFVYTSPSVFLSMQNFLGSVFEFPAIFSCESLTENTRKDAEQFFTNVIDKMRDWTTGFGFFECSKGVRHVYDDLCVARQGEGNEIRCLDFFNPSGKEKISDDRGFICKRKCECGTYGNIVESFQGKHFECLISAKGTKYSANLVSNQISALKKMGLNLKEYQILQDKEKNIIIRTKSGLDDQKAIMLAKSISYLLLDKELKIATIINEEKNLHSGCDVSIRICKEGFDLCSNKIISLRTLAN